MFMSLRLWALYFRSKLRRGNPAHKAAAEEETARARDLAQQIMERERAALDAEGVGNLFDDEIMLDIELQFLWGVFRELVQEYPGLPTNGFDRVKLHLIMRLMDAHGYSFEAARDEAISVEGLYNKADELFDALAGLGQKTFHDGQSGRLLTVAKVLQGTKAFKGRHKLDWSSNPGAYEFHLMRRHNNPYFPRSRREVSQEELGEAKRKDEDDYVSCRRRLAEIVKEIEALSSTVTSGDLLKFREPLDDLILFSMGVGGPAKEIAARADRLRDSVIADLRAALSDDEEAMEKIEKADAYHEDKTRRFYIPVMAQILRKNSPILKEETIPAILSSDPLAISVFMEFLSDDIRAQVRVEALKMMQEALNDGYIDPQFEEKLSALEGEWNFEALFAPSVSADFDEGLAAAQRGDYATALREWRPFAENGEATAQYNLGIMYENGWGVPQDPAQAVQWYREAVKSGNIRFILHLATMYSLGKGVPTDFVQAYMFFSIAAEMGDSRGIKGRDLHAEAMTSDQITEAKTLAREWRMKHVGKT